MASLQEVKDAIAVEKQEVSDRVNELLNAIEELKAQVGSGTAVTAADLDELLVGVQGIFVKQV